MTAPVRLNHFLNSAGYCSRREADRLIAAGSVSVLRDGRTFQAETGQRVLPGDRVFCRGEEIQPEETKKRVYAFHKPKGILCTGDRRRENNLLDFIGTKEYLSYAGRLDRDSTGLVLLTNDTALLDAVSRAENRHEKEYICTVDREVTEDFVLGMASGVPIEIDDGRHRKEEGRSLTVTTRPCRVRKTGPRSFSIVLTQGYNRQIRRMCRALGYRASGIHRVRVMTVCLGSLSPGKLRELTEAECRELYEAAGLSLAEPEKGAR